MGRVRSHPTAGRTGRLWRLDSPPGAPLVLPDGVMDLVWGGRDLILAGPDTAATPFACPDGRVVWGPAAAAGGRARAPC
jgi:hypothetical protein